MNSVGETSQAGLARELTNLTKSLVIATRWALDHRIEQIGSASARFVPLTTSKSILRVPTFPFWLQQLQSIWAKCLAHSFQLIDRQRCSSA